MPTALTQAIERCHSSIDRLDGDEQAYAVWYLTEHLNQHLTEPLREQLHALLMQIDRYRTWNEQGLPDFWEPPASVMEHGRDVIHEALESFRTLTEALNPDELAQATERMETLAETLESDLEWDRLFATPESQAFLAELAREAQAEFEAGETVEGGWEA